LQQAQSLVATGTVGVAGSLTRTQADNILTASALNGSAATARVLILA
jgi:hypothetical protein